MLWYRALNENYREVIENPGNETPDGTFRAFPTGDTLALLTLAFDVYILRQQGNLPSKLLDRLRSKDQFQGARYEIAIAATFVRAGFDVEFLDEKVQKRGEFIARHLWMANYQIALNSGVSMSDTIPPCATSSSFSFM